jgi:hypothetical protein
MVKRSRKERERADTITFNVTRGSWISSGQRGSLRRFSWLHEWGLEEGSRVRV